MTPMGMALVGIGPGAVPHLLSLNDLRAEVDLRWAIARRPEAAQMGPFQGQLQPSSDFQAMLGDPAVQAVIIATPAATVARAQRIIALYQAHGVAKERVLIKIAATWEGIQAAAQLQQQGIATNLTLLFAYAQAVACGQARVQLISPFVGRIYDWHKKAAGAAWDEVARSGVHDPGVVSVTHIFHAYKQHGIATEVMGASFRHVGQITALAGCDLLTISPELLAQLAACNDTLHPALDAKASAALDMPWPHLNEADFRLALNQDAMATEKLAEGIRAFCTDAVQLEALMKA